MPINWRSVRPEDLRPQFRSDVQGLFDALPDSFTATHGRRTLAEQDALYEKYLHLLAAWKAYREGRGPKPAEKPAKAAPPGKSPHNYGLAVDVVLDGSPAPGLQPDWNISHPGWQRLFEAVWQHPRLHSGRSFGDADHIEALGWKAQK